ncbi:MAG: hypothetical protein J6C23_06420 [Clostridia bacterium]|nr:hypothetical protein [Clostridia bacterium]
METMSVSSLWRHYDRKALPLDVTVLKTAEEENCTIEYVFFNGEATVDGCVRVYGEYYKNKAPNGASVIVMNDAEMLMDRKHVNLFLSRGYHVLLLDYAGEREEKGYFTVYPLPLKKANYFANPKTLVDTEYKLKTTCWYVWATVMLRGITFLESKQETNPKKINLFGEKLGAFQVWKTAFVEPDVCSAIVLNNSGYVSLPFTEDANFNYQTCLNNFTYAQQTKVPVLIQVSTNASDNSIDYMNGLYIATSNERCNFSISERSDNQLGYRQWDNIRLFMNYYNFGMGRLPHFPEIKPVQEGHELYYEVTVDKDMTVDNIEVFVSQGIDNDAYKNWRSYKPELNGDIYKVKVSVPNNKQEMSAFVNVKYADSLSVSSEIVKNIPFLMGVNSTPIKSSRLLYTSEYGLDEWTSKKGSENGESVLKTKRGSCGISGVTSQSNSLTTYKLGDPSYTGAGKALLQIMLYSRINQDISFIITRRIKESFKEYYYTKTLYAHGDWVKIDLLATDFRSMDGMNEDWDNIVCITIDSEDAIIINSMLWI